MKKQAITLSLLTLTALPAAAAIDCAVIPTCAELGYNDTVASCKDANNVLKCPFDKTLGKCLFDTKPKVGDLKYSLQSSNHDGWLLCDGTQYAQATYAELYNVIQLKFCHQFTSRTDTGTSSSCKANYFAVPDYRGFYLRGLNSYNANSNTVSNVSGYYSNALSYKGDTSTITNIGIPSYEQLPNVRGAFGADGNGNDDNSTVTEYSNGYYKGDKFPTGPFTFKRVTGIKGPGDTGDGGILEFSLKGGNTIYDGSHVRPATYGAYIFIYAGK